MAQKLVSLKIEGFKELEKNIKTLENKIQLKLMRKALRAGAKVIQKDARQRVPVDEGKLLKSIKLKSVKRSRKSIGVNIQTGDRQSLGIPPTAKGYYPFSIEYGTKKRPARPYMRPALVSNRMPATAAVGKSLEASIKAEVRKMKK